MSHDVLPLNKGAKGVKLLEKGYFLQNLLFNAVVHKLVVGNKVHRRMLILGNRHETILREHDHAAMILGRLLALLEN